MTPFEFVLLGAAGFAAGVLNAVAGGGTIFSFSALLAVGVPPVAANATSAAAVVLGSVASTLAYRREISGAFRRLLPLCLVSVVGGSIGAVLLLRSGDALFRALVPWLLLFATLLFAAAPLLKRWIERRAARRPDGGGIGLAVPAQGLVSVYGGYFGAGMGVMMLASLALTEGDDYHAINAVKNLLSILLQAVAVTIFLWSGVVHLGLSLLVAVCSILGGWFGVAAARRVPESLMRRVVILSGLALSLWYFFR